MNGFFYTLIRPGDSDLTPFEFLVPITCTMFMYTIFVVLIISLTEAILPIIIAIGSVLITLGVVMTKFSYEYLRSISLKGFGFILFGILAYFIYHDRNMFPTDDFFVNSILLIIFSLVASSLLIYATVELVFAITFSRRRIRNAKWDDSNGKLHIDSRYVYFHSDDGKKSVVIRCGDIVDVKSDSKYTIVYFITDSKKVYSERFSMPNPVQTYKDIKKILGI